MNSKFNVCLFAIMISTFCACDNSNDNIPENEELLEAYIPVYVSEIVQENYKNTYSYERIGEDIRLRQIEYYEDNIKKHTSIMQYDSQNRLIGFDNPFTENMSDGYHDEMFKNYIDNNCVIKYDNNQIISISDGQDDDDELDEVLTYTLNAEGLVAEFKNVNDDELLISTFVWSYNNYSEVESSYSYIDEQNNSVFSFEYDNMNSIDYVVRLLPCMYNKNNLLRVHTRGSEDKAYETLYTYKYNSYDYPTEIVEVETEYVNGKITGEVETTTKTIKYINVEDIK